MSSVCDVLVVGAGPAGVAAAVELASRGVQVLLVEQRPTAGGAIHRAAFDGQPSTVKMPARHKRNWARLRLALERHADRIRVLTEAVFLGIDGHGVCLIDHRVSNQVKLVKPKAIVFATGAIERVPHVPGWDLSGVVTAGGLQVQMKESGQAPRGRILIAASGPLPIAVGAQLAALGNAPVAVLERARPLRNLLAHPAALLGLMAGPRQLVEALGYFRVLMRAKVPYRTGIRVKAVRRENDRLVVETTDDKGNDAQYVVDTLVLHDGLARNDRGLPTVDVHGIAVARAGDCNEVLGADAAITEGRKAAQRIASRLSGRPVEPHADAFDLARVFQQSLANWFEKPPVDMTDETIVCRCERVTNGNLASMNFQSPREMRLVGRVGMGLCQGRFCAHVASQSTQAQDVSFAAADIDGASLRWPIRPVSIKALAAAEELEAPNAPKAL
ncbi:FAD-dependent oxidoreductase [Trinickia dinghuensis]|uniref:FAD-dependent oxidoreductase n=1 Tax=Trinickia dinghuensis TaxID=2291023 RepID=A0A3D8JW81_9BURK|nr:FAD-dependent oxidoreductase [Trinickia dinghuensis]RDU97403.1 FAD-dependent oxidoreductase [Trinickia dinghuensis]